MLEGWSPAHLGPTHPYPNPVPYVRATRAPTPCPGVKVKVSRRPEAPPTPRPGAKLARKAKDLIDDVIEVKTEDLNEDELEYDEDSQEFEATKEESPFQKPPDTRPAQEPPDLYHRFQELQQEEQQRRDHASIEGKGTGKRYTRKRESDDNTWRQLSKSMTWYLRYGPGKRHDTEGSGPWRDVGRILLQDTFRRYTLMDVEEMVYNSWSRKRRQSRFELKREACADGNNVFIRTLEGFNS